MTAKIIIYGVIIVCIIDIILVIIKQITISTQMRNWYQELPLVAFIVGVLFIGHFGLTIFWTFPFPQWLRLFLFICLDLVIIVWTIIQEIKEIRGKKTGKFYNLCCKYFPIPMAIGALVGWLWS